MLYPNCGLIMHLYAHIYNLNSVSLTLFTNFLLIVLTVELTCFPASTHCLEGFALLCIITFKSISYSITFYTRKNTQRQTQRASKGSHNTFILLKKLIVFQRQEWGSQCDGCCCFPPLSLEIWGWMCPNSKQFGKWMGPIWTAQLGESLVMLIGSSWIPNSLPY